MEITITVADIEAFGEPFNTIRDRKTYGKLTGPVYRGMKPFYTLLDDYRKTLQQYIKEHTEEGARGIQRFVSSEDTDEMSDKMKEELGVAETEEWNAYQAFVREQRYVEYSFTTKPIIDEKTVEKCKLTPNEQHVFDVLGLLILPDEEDENEEDENEEDE